MIFSKLSVCDSRVDCVAPSSVLSVSYDKICIKFASHHLLLHVVYMCQKSLNCIQMLPAKNVSGFTLAGPPCMALELPIDKISSLRSL